MNGAWTTAWRVTTVVAIAVALVAGFLGGPAVAEAQVPKVIKFGVQPSTQPPYIAREAGFFKEVEEKFKTKIEFFTFPFGGPQNVAFAAGELDFSQKGMAPVAVAMQRGKGKLLLINILEQTAIIVQPEVNSMADLKGKKVAHPGKGSQQYPLLLLALDRAGVKHDEVDLIRMDAVNMAIALQKKELAGYIAWDPHTTKSLVGGFGKVLIRVEQLMPLKAGHYLGEGVVVREDFPAKYPELTRAVVQALLKANAFIVDRPEDAIRMWSKALGLDEKIIQYSMQNKMAVYIKDLTPDVPALKKYFEFLNKYEITSVTDIDGFLKEKVDLSYLQ
jgi:NitT/TauT family transport system substrate-binding protein/sulfonate transport system substrate-binding protein